MQSFDRELNDWLDGFSRRQRWMRIGGFVCLCSVVFILSWMVAAYAHTRTEPQYTPTFMPVPAASPKYPGNCVVTGRGKNEEGTDWVRIECGKR